MGFGVRIRRTISRLFGGDGGGGVANGGDGIVGDDKKTEVYYRLARSVVRISGEVTEDYDPKTSEPRTLATSDIEVGVEADSRLAWRCQLPMGQQFMKDKQFDLALTADGRLASSSVTVAGAGTAVLEAGLRVGTFLGSALLGARGLVQEEKPEKRTFDQTLEAENESLYKRREAYRTAITALQDKLAEHGSRVAASPATSGVSVEGSIIRGTLERVRAEAEQVQLEVDAWRRTRFPTSTDEHDFTVGTDSLPQLEAATPTATFELAKLPAALRDAAEQLGVVVARVGEAEEDALNFTPEDLEDESGIWFRNARRTNLALYERELGSPDQFKLRSITPAWVVDSDSRLGFLRFDSGLFDKQTGTLEFGDTGALTRLASSDDSPARQLATALSAAPAQVKESVEQAGAVVEGLSKLRSAGADRRLADLKRRKDTVDAEIAEKGVLATRAQREELDRLKAEIDVTDARKKLVPEPEKPPSPNKEIEERIARARLELELKQAEVEMEWLRRELPQGNGQPG